MTLHKEKQQAQKTELTATASEAKRAHKIQ